MMSNQLSLVEITGPDDDLFLPWLDLYETAFPAYERVLISDQIRLLRAKRAGGRPDEKLFALLQADSPLAGLVQYQFFRSLGVIFLWYLAVQPNLRSQGFGSWAYQALCRDGREAGCKTAIFEVEIPEKAESAEGTRLAERRIAFYRREGAYLLEGIEYDQVIGWHAPPTRMHLMIHPFQALPAQEAFDLAKELFDDSLRQVGPLSLR